MSEESKGAEITQFKIEHRLDTTVTINGNTNSPTWIKPGVNTGFTFNGIPTNEQIRAASKYMSEQILDPLIAEIVENVAEQLKKSGMPPQF